jgi:hypothetical protein
MMILKIGIGVMWLIFIGTANHLIGHIIQEHFITSLLGSLALVNIHFLLSKLAWQVFWTKINFIQMKLPNFVNSLPGCYSQVPIKRVGPNKRVGWIF